MRLRQILGTAIASVLLSSCAANNNEYWRQSSRIVASPSFHNADKRFGVMHEAWNYNAEHLWFQQRLTQQLMANGYTIVERTNLDAVMKDISLDNSGVIKPNQDSSSSNKEKSLDRNALKKIGEMYGIKYMIWFGQHPGSGSYLSTSDAYVRVINLETAEICVVATIHSLVTGNGTILNLMPFALGDAIAFADNMQGKVAGPVYISTLSHGSNMVGWTTVNVLWRRDLGDGVDLALYQTKP